MRVARGHRGGLLRPLEAVLGRHHAAPAVPAAGAHARAPTLGTVRAPDAVHILTLTLTLTSNPLTSADALLPRRTPSFSSARFVYLPGRDADRRRPGSPTLQLPTPPLWRRWQVACFALGQFSEHCQPDILHYHSTVLPVVFHALDDARETVQSTACYVLEMFLENLSRETLRPFLQPLLTRLMTKLTTVKTKISQEMALTAISSVAVAAEFEFLPFSEVRMRYRTRPLVGALVGGGGACR